MKIKLVEPKIEYEQKLINAINEFFEVDNIKNDINGSSNITSFDSIQKWLDFINKKNLDVNLVPFNQYLVINETNELIGFVNIRLSLNNYLLNFGGHIGYSVVPSHRQKGYATEILNQALKECWKNNIFEVLVTCKKDNTISEKVILKNGGVLEDLRENDKIEYKRFWINKTNGVIS
ncbi:GNAT family N-acetyltransferase [Spiroplasma floricola]|uniref:GNAT family acetyltransferase n=1 Tax=Spiroplasma floricola 23-6 TaxID=1336749 RepID=A0A2K8SDJ4_9MOLU|nr:GNAT family N-acetyltransferase [Spiroplasma floricola]AUB31531.1 GNAT family acetyltransferase [Spiroplasma floricola 23-6]